MHVAETCFQADISIGEEQFPNQLDSIATLMLLKFAKKNADTNDGHIIVTNLMFTLSMATEVCQMLSPRTKTTKSNRRTYFKHADRFLMNW